MSDDSNPIELDDVDRILLGILARNARHPTNGIVPILAKSGIKMSERGIAKRIKKLEENGVIQGYTIVLNPQKFRETHYRVVLIRFKSTASFQRRVKDFKRYLTESPFCMFAGRTRGALDWINFKVFPSRETADLESDFYRSCFGDIIHEYRAYDVMPLGQENHTRPMLITEEEVRSFLRRWGKISKIA